MNCKSAEEIILTDYIDGKSAPQTLREVEAHIASCGRCSEIVARLKSVGGAFRTVPRMEAPLAVWERIRSEIGEKSAQVTFLPGFFEPVRIFLARLRPALVITATAAIIFVVLTMARLMPQKGTSAIQDDIVSMAASYEIGNGTEYDFGTPEETYFL